MHLNKHNTISTDEKVNKSLEASFRDGIFASGMMGFTQDYFTPFLLLLKATATQVGMLNALPNLFSSLIQLKSADITEMFKSRKAVITIFVLLQAFMLLPMAVIALLDKVRPEIFIGIVICFTAFGAIATPAWGSLMSDLVPGDKRGTYFGWRTTTLGFIIVGASFLGGLILTIMKRQNIFYGFIILFSFAFIFRTVSWYFLTRMYEPSIEYKKEHYFSFIQFVSHIHKSNFGRFVIFVSAMNFSANLCSPFFAVLMLRDLHFSYLVYSVVTVTATLTIYLMTSRWGRHADKVGNLRIIRFTAPLIGVIPLLWIFNREPVYLVCAQIFSGFLWAGFNICTTNFIYDAVRPEKMTRCISFFNVFNGLALSIGALCGGFLLQYLKPLMGYNVLTLLLISSVLRLAVGIFMPMVLKEVRTVDHVNHNELFFSVIGIRPMLEADRKTVK